MSEVIIRDRGRGPELARIRITVYDIIPYLEGGWAPEEIPTALPITLEEVRALILYIEEHKAAVMAVHRQIEERIARGNPPEIEARVQASQARLKALREELASQHQEDGRNGTGHPG